MKRTYSFGKRLLAMLLCVAMVAAYFPAVATTVSAAVAGDKTVDPSTIHGWKSYFGPNVMSTEYTGGVWTDKSVFDSFSAYQTEAGVDSFVSLSGNGLSDAVKQMLATDPENFLIALSAITANKSVSGSSSAPMDTMLVLDVSGSMQGDKATAMVQATNEAIDTLLKQSTNNRVGVVLYSGNSNFGNSAASTASVILSLGRYTTTNTMNVTETVNGVTTTRTIPAYLTISGSGNGQRVSVASSVNNGSNTDSKNVVGGTYIQNGLYKAWQQFSAVTDTKVPEGQVQAGAQRTPVIILMSDGAPTAATTSYNNIGTSNLGDGGSTTNRIGFMTQLTASWVRGKVEAKYGTEAKFYTLGIGTGNDDIATSVLNPSASNNTLSTYWDRFLAGTDGQNVQITTDNNRWSVYKDAAVTTKVYVESDHYWLASNASGLIDAFKKIVETIVLDSESHSTLVEEIGADMSGYVTFEDELGELMEVKSIKGLTIGDVIFTGAELAKDCTSAIMGTTEAPTDYGTEFINTVKERLGITDTAVAQRLVANAYTSGQLSYTSATQFSNYIGWYADADGNYMGFWQESDGYGADAAPEGAVYINKSYGYLGKRVNEENASDMMHVVVMVHTEIATGHQSIVFKIPASLIPTVTYNVALQGSDPSQVKSITRDAAEPMRLLMEVGLREDLNAINLEAKIAEHIENGGHIHENADGTYTFYTNRWGSGDGHGDVDYNEPLTHLVTESHFHPALDNERYYHVNDVLIYSGDSGTVYTGATAPSGDGYYFARTYYEVVNGTAKQTVKYAALGSASVAKAVQGAGGWYVPAGTPQQLTRFAQEKSSNATETLKYSWNPVVLHDSDGYNSYAFLGNNGSVTVAPAQGIALSKTVTEAVEGAPTEFTFTVTLSQAVASPVITDADGNAISGIATVNGNVITVKVAAGQTVLITGIPTGTTYTVEEQKTAYYAASSANASGAVAAHTIHPVDFTNAPKGYGNLIISKDVTHPFVTEPEALTQKQFTIQVTLSGSEVANKTFQTTGLSGVTSVTTDSNGTFTVQLRDGESITVLDLPEDTTYTTTELLSATADKGYSMDASNSVLSGTIVKDASAQAHVVNVYAPSEPVASITVSGTKTVADETGSFDWNGKSFTFKLEQYHPETGAYTQVGDTVTVTAQGGTYAFKDALKFNAIGTYYYKVSEVIPQEADRLEGMSYDATTGRFVVYVTDNDVDGMLEFEVRDYTTGDAITGSENVFTFTKNFVNTHSTDATYVEFTVDKTVTDPHNTGVSEAGFLFGLFEVTDGKVATEPSYTMRTVLLEGTKDGKATFHIPLTKVSQTTYILKEIKPTADQQLPGMIYDPTEYTVVVSATAESGKLVPGVTFAKGTSAITEAELVFNNEIKLNPTSVQWTVEKVMQGHTPATAEEFTFALTETDGSFVTAKEGGVQDSITITGAGSDSFKSISYAAIGTHYYVIRETAGDRGGMTYDPAIYHVTVNVTANGDDLAAATTISKLGSGEAQKITFTNSYTIDGTAEVQLDGIKYLEGRELIAGEFAFGLYQGEELLHKVENLTNGKFTFPVLTYTAEDIGTHTYTVKEIVPETKLGGVAYTDAKYTVVVTVSDNGAGGLKVTKTVNGSANGTISFTNTYSAAPTSATISGTKTWYNTDTGANMATPAGKFTFELYSANEDFTQQGDLITSASNKENGSFSITRSYTKAGDYYYILREVIGEEKGVSYDAGRYFIRVLVSDTGEGKLTAVKTVTKEGVGAAETIVFGNTYTPQPATAVISGTKKLTGRDIVEGEFAFELYDAQGNLLQTVSDQANGAFAFDELSYTTSGTYTYTVKEKIPTGAVNNVYKGVTYDTNSYTVTVKVTDADLDGQLDTQVEYPTGGLVFNNSYDGLDASFNVKGKKTLENKTIEAGQFTFEMYDKNGVRVGSTTNDAAGNFVFDHIPLSAVDTYTYTVVEKLPNGAGDDRIYRGIYYSDVVYNVKVVVTDPGDGQMKANVTVTAPDGTEVEQADFTNTYQVGSTTAAIRGVKVLQNKQLTGGAFTFELYDAEGNLLQSVTNAADGSVVFEPITYTTADTYTYTVKEVAPASGKENGITYDTVIKTVQVTVVDNGDGSLTATPVYENGILLFVNTYEITETVKIDISGIKELTGKAMESFTFELYDESGNKLATAKNGTGREFVFEDVELTEARDYIFTVKEVIPAEAVNGVYKGIRYDTREFKVYVTARDNGVGGLTAGPVTFSVNGTDSTVMTFRNSYSVGSTHAVLTGTKELTGKKLEAGMFTFEVLEGTKVVATGANRADGTIAFTPITYTGTGDHTYTVVEKIPAEAVNNVYKGVTYSTQTFTATVSVTDNGDGTLSADIAYPNGSVKFVNSYAADGTSVTLSGVKKLENKSIGNNMFTFELYNEAGDKLQTVKNAGETFQFAPVDLNEAKLYTFTVKEQIPEDAVETVYKGVDYDERVYTVTVEVTDNGEGSLVAGEPKVSLNGAPAQSIQFHNVYSVTGTTHVDIAGTKKLTGKPMVPGEFTFELYDANNTLVDSVTNTETGSFLFDNVTLTAAGDNLFTVVEKDLGVDNMEYDLRTYQVKVKVSDNGEGGLKVDSTQITLENKPAELVFENTYTPEKITVELDITKTVQSPTEQTMGPDGFVFQLLDETGKQLTTVTSDAEGKAVFQLGFGAEEIGKTFKLKVSEVDTKKTGVVYSDSEYAVEITVKQANDGALSAEVKLDGKLTEQVAMKFVNIYEPPVNPVTGDELQIVMFFSLMVLSSFGIVAMTICKKRQEEKEASAE